MGNIWLLQKKKKLVSTNFLSNGGKNFLSLFVNVLLMKIFNLDSKNETFFLLITLLMTLVLIIL